MASHLFLQSAGISVILSLVLMRRERCTTAGGWLHHPKGGEANAAYDNFDTAKADVSVYHKKQKPPLRQVTVSLLKKFHLKS